MDIKDKINTILLCDIAITMGLSMVMATTNPLESDLCDGNKKLPRGG
ncbi:hypothetical protein I5438_02905 [Citrobacter freundii]|nr:hypothetical protein [Citrobacter freundii]MBJ8975074.1 hypothetical protein [Citrobacter freundii]MBJ9012266.1 hypothetical protein [Citrobacter freundii]